MIRSYHTLACAILGMVFVMLVQRGVEIYLFIALGLAIPWDKLAKMTGELAADLIERRAPPDKEEAPEAGLHPLE